jgi:hypothetical protein
VLEEQLAESLRAIPNAEGQFARYDLWLQVGDGLVHALHHIGTTSSSAHEASAVNAELTAEFVEAARWGDTPADVTIRSHRHRYIETRFATDRGVGISVVTPGWQGKTPFAWKIAGARLAPPQFGGLVVRRGDRRLYTDAQVWTPARSGTEHEMQNHDGGTIEGSGGIAKARRTRSRRHDDGRVGDCVRRRRANGSSDVGGRARRKAH